LGFDGQSPIRASISYCIETSTGMINVRRPCAERWHRAGVVTSLARGIYLDAGRAAAGRRHHRGGVPAPEFRAQARRRPPEAGNQVLIAAISGPTPMIAITRFML